MKVAFLSIVSAVVLFSYMGSALEGVLYSFEGDRLKGTQELIEKKHLDVIKSKLSIEKILQQSNGVSVARGAPAELYAERSNVAYKVALSQTNAQVQRDYGCMALSNMGRAVAKEPFHAGYASRWALLKVMLGKGHECPYGYTTGDVRKVVDFALDVDPTNLQVVRNAMFIHIASENVEMAAKFIKRYQELTPQRNTYVDANVKVLAYMVNDLHVLIPGRYAHVMHWSKYFEEHDKSLLVRHRESLESLQLAAIQHVRALHITSSHAISNLSKLLRYAVTDTVRRKIDSELLYYLHPDLDKGIRSYLSRRSQLRLVNSVCGLTYGDSRPTRSNLNSWGYEGGVYFDKDYQSVGCFVTSPLTSIELVNSRKDARLYAKDIQVFISSDNYEWVDVTRKFNFEKYTLKDKLIFASEFPTGNDFMYVKLRYKQTMHYESFAHGLQRMVKFYAK